MAGIEARRAASALRASMIRAGTARMVGGANARPVGMGMGEIDGMALATGGMVTEDGELDGMAVATGGYGASPP